MSDRLIQAGDSSWALPALPLPFLTLSCSQFQASPMASLRSGRRHMASWVMCETHDMRSSWGGGAEVAMRKGHTAGRKRRVPAQLDPPQMHAHPSTVTEEEGRLYWCFVVITSSIPKSDWVRGL